MDSPTPTLHRPRRPWAQFGLLGIAAVLVATFLLVLTESRLSGSSRWASDPRLITTTPLQLGIPANPTLRDRLGMFLLRTVQRLQGPRPLNTTFAASPTNRCSIHALLNQCTTANGIRYHVEHEVAGGNVEFGHPKAMNGLEWPAAILDALQHGRVEWWDAARGSFRQETLVVFTNSPRSVLVVSRSLAAELGLPAPPGPAAPAPLAPRP